MRAPLGQELFHPARSWCHLASTMTKKLKEPGDISTKHKEVRVRIGRSSNRKMSKCIYLSIYLS